MRKELKMDKCREEFEAFCKQNDIGYQMSFSQYHSARTDVFWGIWKASRESMKSIKLPDYLCSHQTDGDYCNAYNTAVQDSKRSITSAGYKVEE